MRGSESGHVGRVMSDVEQIRGHCCKRVLEVFAPRHVQTHEPILYPPLGFGHVDWLGALACAVVNLVRRVEHGRRWVEGSGGYVASSDAMMHRHTELCSS